MFNNLQFMDSLIEFLIQYGYWGMLLSAFIAGSVFPLSSEAVLVALLAAGLNDKALILYATIGNVGGGMFNYAVGALGKPQWIEKILRIDKKKIEQAQRFMDGRGAWMGFFAFLPFIGEAITVVLGLMRANIPVTLISMTIGKLLRFILLVYGTHLFI